MTLRGVSRNIGMTQHPALTKQHSVTRLVWFEEHDEIARAIEREKQIKGWNRAWKLRLIEKSNPHERDLTARL